MSDLTLHFAAHLAVFAEQLSSIFRHLFRVHVAVGFRGGNRGHIQRARGLISAKTLLSLYLRIAILVLLIVLRSHGTPLLHTSAMFLLGGENTLTKRHRVASAFERRLVRVHVRESTHLIPIRWFARLVEARVVRRRERMQFRRLACRGSSDDLKFVSGRTAYHVVLHVFKN